jgi:hypothetical protein
MYSRAIYAVTPPADTWVVMTLDQAGATTWPIRDPTRTLSCRFRVVARAEEDLHLLSYACAEFEGNFVCYYDTDTAALVIILGSVSQTAATAFSAEASWDMQVTSNGEYLEIQCTQTSSETLPAVRWEGIVDVVETKVISPVSPP